MKNCIIKLGNGSYYVRHTGDGWLDTTKEPSQAFRMERKVAEDYLPTLRGNAQYRYLHTDSVIIPFEVIELNDFISVSALLKDGYTIHSDVAVHTFQSVNWAQRLQLYGFFKGVQSDGLVDCGNGCWSQNPDEAFIRTGYNDYYKL